MSILTFDSIKIIMGLEHHTIADYPKIGLLMPLVEASILGYIQAEVDKKERIEEIILNNSSLIMLKALPIISVSSLILSSRGTESPTNAYKITSYGIKLFGWRDVGHNSFPLAYRMPVLSATVTYIGGYTFIPAEITKAALTQFIYEYKRMPDIGANVVSGEGGSVSYPELGLLAEVKRLLEKYIHPGAGAW
jgi:hypothetical protein